MSTFLATGLVPAASAAPGGFINIGGATVVEGGRAAFDITLSEPSNGTVSVRWTTARDTAIPGGTARDNRFCNGDYKESHGTATFPANATEKRVYVQTCPDLRDEPVPERFMVGLVIGSAIGGYDLGSHSTDFGTIIDQPPCTCGVDARIGDVSVVEGNAGKNRFADFTVSLYQPSTSAVSIDYTVASDTAACGPIGKPWMPTDPSSDCWDLNGATKTLVFPVVLGKTKTSSVIRIPIFPDINGEQDESFNVTISNARNASGPLLISRAVGVGAIINDD